MEIDLIEILISTKELRYRKDIRYKMSSFRGRIFTPKMNAAKLLFLYPTQRVAEGIMFLTRQSVSLSVSQSVSLSVSQSVSPVFLVSTTPLKPLDRIS